MQVPIYQQLKGHSYSITDVQANTVSYYLHHRGFVLEAGSSYDNPNSMRYSNLLFVHDKKKDVYYFGPFIKHSGRTSAINTILGYKLTEDLFYKMVDEGKIIVLEKGFNKITREEYHLLNKGTLTYSQLLNNIPD